MNLLESVEYKNGDIFWKKPPTIRTKIGDRVCWKRPNGYRRFNFNKRTYNVHHVVWFMHKGYWPKEIDHINRIRDDNRIENLREVSRSENLYNATFEPRGSNPYRGVYNRGDCKNLGLSVSVGTVKRIITALMKH